MELASQIIAEGYPKETREEMFFASMDQTIRQMRSSLDRQLPEDDRDAVKILDDWIAKYTEKSKDILRQHIPAIMDAMAQAYAETFTVEELCDILRFARSDSGKRFFDQMPKVLGSSSFVEANQAYIDETMLLMAPAQRDLLEKLRLQREKRSQQAEPI